MDALTDQQLADLEEQLRTLETPLSDQLGRAGHAARGARSHLGAEPPMIEHASPARDDDPRA